MSNKKDFDEYRREGIAPITDESLLALLMEAYKEGWAGSMEMAEEVTNRIYTRFVEGCFQKEFGAKPEKKSTKKRKTYSDQLMPQMDEAAGGDMGQAFAQPQEMPIQEMPLNQQNG